MPPDDGEPSDPDEGPVLSPDDLEIAEDDNVTEIDDGRYVISPSGARSPPVEPGDTVENPTEADQPSPTDLTEQTVQAWLDDKLSAADARYGFHITGKFDDGVHHQTLMTNDVVTTFENLLRWYARHAGGNTSIEEVIGILLMEADTTADFPVSAMETLVAAHGLDRSDSIGDLLDQLNRAGFRFPR